MAKEAKPYSKEVLYEKRDLIYHPQFKEQGKITKIEVQSNESQVLTVEFKESGTRKLIAGVH